MTLKKQEDLLKPNERGNGPKHLMEGGDQSDDIAINDPAERRRQKRKDDHDKKTQAPPK
ncbi:MAG TPA: hypothetical protein VN030_07955 [Cellvibrio sp.]|nr:hypothetical protein [Cellvibrio sp.]